METAGAMLPFRPKVQPGDPALCLAILIWRETVSWSIDLRDPRRKAVYTGSDYSYSHCKARLPLVVLGYGVLLRVRA
jgi:hypothetical protein